MCPASPCQHVFKYFMKMSNFKKLSFRQQPQAPSVLASTATVNGVLAREPSVQPLPAIPAAVADSGANKETMLRRRDPLANGKFSFEVDSDAALSVDYSSAGLYVVGIQTVLGCVCCAATSVLFCWALPRAAISAVRTLAGTSAVAVLFVSKTLRLGRVRGVNTVFNALRVSVPLYIFALVIEQILHTCTETTRDEDESIALRVVFHIVVAFMILSGFVRARRPISETDMSFLIVMGCFLILALLPPPATALTGPLCEPQP